MNADRQLIVLPDGDLVAQYAATRLITTLVDAQAAWGQASVVLTGGGIGTATLAAVAAHPARDAVDWTRIDVFWGDERFVPDGDSDRNDRAADEALLDQVPLDPARVHRMPTSDAVSTPEEAAQLYASILGAIARRDGVEEAVPPFDVLLLGMGPEGHVASIFPDSPAARANGTVVGVRDCPKPPPERISLTFPAIRSAAEVWLLVTTAEKAGAAAAAFRGVAPTEVPAAGAYGRQRTLFVLDRDAASDLPTELRQRG